MRKKAEVLVNKYVLKDSLKRHLFAVEEAMGFYANKFGKDEEYWRITGLLHDFDYEQFPDQHPLKGMEILREGGFPEEMIEAIGGHADYTGIPRSTLLAKTLYAVDELSGFVVAVAYVRPSRLLGDVPVKSVRKKLKDKAFARQVNREEIRRGAEELGIELPIHIQNIIDALKTNPSRLGFQG
ncbi:MAG: HDIG domain-containing protein [Acidobacteria bacterium]|nr:HDIG domain-containing protein [Acidobacteriota bacterium]